MTSLRSQGGRGRDALPLAGFRILDLSRFLSGPFGTMTLADLGAEIIKLESPSQPDDGRAVPPWSRGSDSVYFHSLNRNKKSVCLDIKSAAGRAVFYELVRKADVVFDNFRPGVTSRLGVDSETLSLVNPDIICVSLSGFGHTGPWSERPAYDNQIQALTGLMALTGDPASPPTKTGLSLVDHIGGLYAAIAILAGILGRQHGQRNRAFDVSLLDSTLAMFDYLASIYLTCGEVPTRVANSAHPYIVPARNFQAADRWLQISAFTDEFWRGVCRAIGRPDMAVDPRYAERPQRLRHREVLLKELDEIFATKPSAEWLAALEREGVPCAPILTMVEGLELDQVKAREMIVEIERPDAGPVRVIGNPIKMNPSLQARLEPAPVLGGDTAAVLSGLLGYDDERVRALVEEGVAFDPALADNQPRPSAP